MNGNLFWVPVAIYSVAWLSDFGSQWSRAARAWLALRIVLATGWATHSFLLAASFILTGTTLGVLLSAAAWGAMVVYYFVSRDGRFRPLSLVLLPLAIALLLSAILTTEESLGQTVRAGSPWLWRNVLIAHIVALLAGHLLFATACVSSIAYLLQERQLKVKARPLSGRWPALGTLETLTHRCVSLGFVLLTLGILLGIAVSGGANLWAKVSEWRLIVPVVSWIVYAAFLVAYDYRGRRGRFGALWSIGGFGVVLASLALELTILSAGGR